MEKNKKSGEMPMPEAQMGEDKTEPSHDLGGSNKTSFAHDTENHEEEEEGISRGAVIGASVVIFFLFFGSGYLLYNAFYQKPSVSQFAPPSAPPPPTALPPVAAGLLEGTSSEATSSTSSAVQLKTSSLSHESTSTSKVPSLNNK